MNFLDKQFGRLGNRMFQSAFLYAYSKDHNIDYYFQDEKWFKKYEQDIRRLFGEGIAYTDKVAIHIRRGDYINNPFYVDLWKDGYYGRAKRLFPNEKFLVFSDDIEYCKSQLGRDIYDFSEGHIEEEDLKLMASCKHQIIANSSFSWWAAYLNPNPNKKVIYPKQWHPDGIERTKCPATWQGL